MHIYFSGIGGSGIGPLALIAHQAGFTVSGSDKQDSSYIEYLKGSGISNIHVGQDGSFITERHKQQPIDWVVFSSAVEKENSTHPEILFAKEHKLQSSKRDEFIVKLLKQTNQKMVAIAGTHGKTTTTAMAVWLFKQLSIPISYSVGGKISFAEMGEFSKDAEYFVYEADEYDRNFLSFHPQVSLISGIAHDHPDIYPSFESYKQAFRTFVDQSKYTIAHPKDLGTLGLKPDWNVFSPEDTIQPKITLPGEVNRLDATLVVQAVAELTDQPYNHLIEHINHFPGVSRRFEQLAPNIYTDYAHTPEKIQGALQLAHEVSDNVVVVYEGLHNTRQHFIKKELETLFEGVKKLYVVPSYLAREDESLDMLTPEKLCKIIQKPDDRQPAQLNESLKASIEKHAANGDLVLCLTAGGGGSLDEWLRQQLT